MSQPRLSAEEIAVHLGVTKDSAYAWIADRGMPAHKVGHLWELQSDALDGWLRKNQANVTTEVTGS
ncbi:excisionase family DNA-binding protein [Actinomycetota bacterium]